MDRYQVLKHYFGYDSFRPGQESLIEGLLSGRDVLGIMPTGSGKSLCYQVPALMFSGITLVISPLISLMKDQVAALNQAGVHAAYLNSSLTPGQYRTALRYAKEGRYSLIYVAPERLVTPEFLDFALGTEISMVAVNEAHCVSQWGQDFRPSYLKISEFIRMLPKRPVVGAFTATATKEVREDIVDFLMLQEPLVSATGFDRPNLYFGVLSPKDKYEALKNFIQLRPGRCGIIYCLTRKLVEEVCGKLMKDGFSVTRYHAGLSDQERRDNQDDFIYDRAQIMVATNAFGMGIDKSNVRWVVHYNMPKDMESYYQEAGRAGRDGEPAECILLYGAQDTALNQFLIERGEEHPELDSFTRDLIRERDRERLKKMTFYCFTRDCLREYILRYFGEYGSNYCGNCSNCLSQFETVDMTDVSAALLGCVKECGGRYGMTVILDTLRGASTAKIRQYHLENNSFYGSCSKVSVHRLRQVFQELLIRGYLKTTEDEYRLVKLTERSEEVLSGERFFMKMAKEEPAFGTDGKGKEKGRKKKALVSGMGEQEETLFERLRALRARTAREEKVPPYLVFSDKTLVHMCLLKPQTREEMLRVSGVGEHKLEKYGERFLTEIREFQKEGQ